jgi:proteasome lid subunit RPN8/RPN11
MRRPGFRVEGVRTSAPFRSRQVYADYQMFSDGSGTVLVKPDVAVRLRGAAAAARPRETGGLLSGRPLQDDAGVYVIVSGYIEADADAGRAGGFQLAPAAVAGLAAKAARHDPGAEVVGWWHSHPLPSEYSLADRQTQRIYQQPDRVGLLVFAEGQPWAKAYLGPEARDLGAPRRGAYLAPGLPSPLPPAARSSAPRQAPPESLPPVPVPPRDPGSSRMRPRDSAPGFVIDPAAVLLVVVVAVAVAVLLSAIVTRL